MIKFDKSELSGDTSYIIQALCELCLAMVFYSNKKQITRETIKCTPSIVYKVSAKSTKWGSFCVNLHDAKENGEKFEHFPETITSNSWMDVCV